MYFSLIYSNFIFFKHTKKKDVKSAAFFIKNTLYFYVHHIHSVDLYLYI